MRFISSVTVLTLSLTIASGKAAEPDRYARYIDAESHVVKKPEGDGWDDPFGDGVFRSSWFYGSLFMIYVNDKELYKQISSEHGVTIDDGKAFLAFFRETNRGKKSWHLPKNSEQKFSRDQLAPLLFLLGAAAKHGDGCREICRDILEQLIAIDRDSGNLSDSSQGAIGGNLRYPIDCLARELKADYVGGLKRKLYKAEFSAALKIYSVSVSLPDAIATNDDFSVFNALSLVTLQAILWGKDDDDVKEWRANFKQHGDRGWGPAFRLVSGRSLDEKEITKYRYLHISRKVDNDIVLAQRPSRFLSGEFPPTDDKGQKLVLDYIILQGLRASWK